MEANHDVDIEKAGIIPAELKEMVSELGGEPEENVIIGDLFYRSIKSLFDLGFELASKLNLELVADSIEKAVKGKDKK